MPLVYDTTTYTNYTNKEKTENLKLKIRNFGPITEGEIALKPLTIFIGPNNSGKSYAAMLIHSIFESYSPRYMPRDFPPDFRVHFLLDYHKVDVDKLTKDLNRIISRIPSMREGEYLEIPDTIIEKIYRRLIEIIYENSLSSEITRAYASKLHDLVKIGEKSFELGIEFNSHSVSVTCKKNKIEISKLPKLNFKIKFVLTKMKREIFNIKEKNSEVIVELNSRFWIKDGEKIKKDGSTSILVSSILRILLNRAFGSDYAPACYYLPAARSGILQGHRALAATIMKEIPYIGIHKFEILDIPKFSGVVSDFISSLLEIPNRKSKFYKLAKDFENELISGEIILKKLEDSPYPEIKYKFRGREIPMHRASSTVSELAPLFLYLKYIVKPNSILIIEEPEAHLHPENQRILAKYLVRLIRSGVYVVITTHSEYLVEQFNNFMILSRIDKKTRKNKYRYSEEDYLNYDEVAAYVFKYDADSQGYRIKEVEITEEGISEQEFIDIQEVLYEEIIKLRRDANIE